MAFSLSKIRCSALKDLEKKNHLLSYCIQHSTPLPSPVVQALERTVNMFGEKLVSSVQVLDIGTYTGISALNSALAIPDSGKVYTFERSKRHLEIARNIIKDFKMESKIVFSCGEALQGLEKLLASGYSESFDFSFIDADKANYPRYFDLSMDLLRPGGVIAIDNTLYKQNYCIGRVEFVLTKGNYPRTRASDSKHLPALINRIF